MNHFVHTSRKHHNPTPDVCVRWIPFGLSRPHSSGKCDTNVSHCVFARLPTPLHTLDDVGALRDALFPTRRLSPLATIKYGRTTECNCIAVGLLVRPAQNTLRPFDAVAFPVRYQYKVCPYIVARHLIGWQTLRWPTCPTSLTSRAVHD